MVFAARKRHVGDVRGGKRDADFSRSRLRFKPGHGYGENSKKKKKPNGWPFSIATDGHRSTPFVLLVELNPFLELPKV